MGLDEIVDVTSLLVGMGVGGIGAAVLTSAAWGYFGYRNWRKFKKEFLGEKPKAKGKNLIAVIPANGIITHFSSRTTGNRNAIPRVINGYIKEAVENENVKAVILDMLQCPGGFLEPSFEIADYIKHNMRRETKRSKRRRRKNSGVKRKYEDKKIPIVTSVGSQCASGGYLIASSTDEIIAPDSSEVGSVGVFAYRLDVSKFLENWGAGVLLVWAGKYKTEGLPFFPIADGEKERMQISVNKGYELFVNRVWKDRRVQLEKYFASIGKDASVEGVKKKIATGECFYGYEAKKKGLVDRIGYMDKAIEAVEERGDFAHDGIIEYGRPPSNLLIPSSFSGHLSDLPYQIGEGIVAGAFGEVDARLLSSMGTPRIHL